MAQNITELLQRAADELSLLPEVGCEETVGVADGNEGGLESVLEGLGGTGRGGVCVLNTGELEETLNSRRGNETGTTGGGNKLVYCKQGQLLGTGDLNVTYPDCDGTALSTLLDGQRVRLTEVGTPVASADGENAELGDDNGGTDGSSNFL